MSERGFNCVCGCRPLIPANNIYASTTPAPAAPAVPSADDAPQVGDIVVDAEDMDEVVDFAYYSRYVRQ